MFLPVKKTEESRLALESVSEEDQKKLVNSCVHSLLVGNQKQSVIKKADLHRHHDRQYYKINNAILNYASYELFKHFGHRIYEVDRERLLLVNSSTKFARPASEFSEEVRVERFALFFTLIEVLVSADEKVSFKELYNTLSALDHSEETVKDYTDKWVKQLYLTMTKDNSNPEDKCFGWGARALAELDPQGFKESFLELAGGTEADWPEQIARIEKLKQIPNART